jgi:hypothetical protein
LVGWWALVEPDWEWVANKTGATRLGFSVLLKFFEIAGSLPESGVRSHHRCLFRLRSYTVDLTVTLCTSAWLWDSRLRREFSVIEGFSA